MDGEGEGDVLQDRYLRAFVYKLYGAQQAYMGKWLLYTLRNNDFS